LRGKEGRVGGWRSGRATLAVLALLAPGVRAEDPSPPPPTGWHLSPLELDKASAGFRLRLKGYVQADFRSYRDWTVVAEGGDRSRADPFEWRRFRIGFDGTWKRLSFDLALDPAFDRGDQLKDASMSLRVAPGLRLYAGYLKVPVSPELLTSPSKDDTVERAAVVDGLAPGRDWGALLWGERRRVEYQVGLFAGDGRGRESRARTTAAGRLVLKPLRWLAAGASLSRGDVRAAVPGTGAEAQPNGLAGQSLTGFTFAPAGFVEGRRRRWGTDLRVQTGAVSVWGEILRARELPAHPASGATSDLREGGWSATATWLLTGERKSRTIRPDRPLFGGPGAIELVTRCESLRFESGPGRAGAGFQALQGGLSWWPTRFLRLMGDIVVERYDDAGRAPEPGRRGHYVSFVMRAQVHLPQSGSGGSEP
jgi:phosphate-selective porin OprO/OprP